MRKRFTQCWTLVATLLIAVGWGSGLAAQACALACNNSVNVSLPGTDLGCQVAITYAMVAEDSDATCPGPKTVALTTMNDVPLAGSPFVNASHIGMTIKYTVTHPASGNSCWGTLTVEDKAGPTFSGCDDVTAPCTIDARPTTEGGSVPAPTVDDCSAGAGAITLTYADQTQTFDCGQGPNAAIVTRTWSAQDVNGMVSTCQQTITLNRADLSSNTPVCPAPVSIDCTADALMAQPDQTGYPTFEIDGVAYPIVPGGEGFCTLAANFTDESFDLCGGGQKILRTWTVYDWCLPTGAAGNPWTCIQVIKIEDNDAPTIVAPATVNVAMLSTECGGSVVLPEPAFVADNCSDVTVTVQTPTGPRQPGDVVILAAGNYNLVYTATDGCGNSAADVVSVSVVDNTAPAMVCDEFTTVSLTADGSATISAGVFDDGSEDNCGIAFFEVRRMAGDCGGGSPFGPTVTFTRCDVDQTVLVALRAYDAAGNFNECMVEVTVQDKVAAQILCPEDKILDCGAPIDDLSLYGTATVVDECGADLTETVDVQLNCGTGFIFRTFTAVDASGIANSCTQTIQIINTNPFTGPAEWPADYTLNGCSVDVSTDPDDLPTAPINYSRPVVSSGACDDVVVTYEDQIIPINEACFKILRRWIVVDWCQYNPNDTDPTGYYEYVQVIKVQDNEAPVLLCPVDVTVPSLDNDCGGSFVTLPELGVEDCNPNPLVSYRVDFGVDGTFEVNGLGTDASGDFPIGTHRVQFTAEDGCGNVAQCQFLVTVEDGKKPSPVCMNGLAVELMQTPNGSMIELAAELFNNGSFDNCTPGDQLEFTITPSIFTCNDIGTQPVTFFVTDAAGNTDFCETYVIVQDNMVTCDPNGPQMVQVMGTIATDDADGIGQVQVHVSGNGATVAPTTTGNSGGYAFPTLESGYDYTLTPTRTDDADNGVTTLDIVLLQMHILNLQPLTSPYQLLAADVNNSQTLTSLDLIAMRRVILHLDDEFANVDSWRFVRADHQFNDPTDPWADNFAEVYNLNNLAADMSNADFVGIKMGDLNGNAAANADQVPTEDRSAVVLPLEIDHRRVLAGQTFTLPVRLRADGTTLLGYQFALDLDGLELLDVRSDQLDATNYRATTDRLTVSAHDALGLTTDDAPLFTLELRAERGGALNQLLSLAPDFRAEGYDARTDRAELQLAFVGSDTYGRELTLYQNIPNPFQNVTTIGFQLPTAGPATLRIYDQSGKTRYSMTQEFAAGYNALEIDQTQLGAPGVLFYQLETETGSATRRMILTQ